MTSIQKQISIKYEREYREIWVHVLLSVVGTYWFWFLMLIVDACNPYGCFWLVHLEGLPSPPYL